MFTDFLDADYRNLIEDKLRTSIKTNKLSEYKEALVTRGVDLSYTLEARGLETPTGSVEDIADAAVEVILNEIDGVVTSIVAGEKAKDVKGFKRKGKIKVTKAAQALRGRGGRFIGALRLATLLNSMVKIKATEIMKNLSHGNTLNYRTGRLANSVNITSFNLKTRSVYFSYMHYPYQTFEPGFKQFKPGRDPRDIFSNAIAEALTELISVKDLSETRFSVYSGRSKHGNISGGSFK